MTAKMSFCVQAATTLPPYDLDAITDAIEVMAKAGLDMRDAERLAVESALTKARQDRAETAAAVREQHSDLYVPKRAKAPSVASAPSNYFTMPADYIEPPRQARRISQGRPSIEDPVVPESKGFEGTMSGDLAVVPALGSIKSKPVRLPVGAAYGPHKGFGMEHIKDNAERNRMRAPPGVTPDAAENFARHVVGLLRSGMEIYQDANGDVVVRDGRIKQAVVLEDRGGHYSVKTVRPSTDPMIWGQMIGRKRLSPPVGELLAPGKATAYKFDMSGPEVRMAPVGTPSVSIKPRRQFEMPLRQSRAQAAEAAGFDSSVEWLHGTTKGFNSFRRGKPGRGVNELGPGIYFTKQELYARAWSGRDDNARIVRAYLKRGDFFDLGKLRSVQGPRQLPNPEEMRNIWIPLAQRIKANNTAISTEQSMTAPTNDLWKTWLAESDRDFAEFIRASRGTDAAMNTWLERAGYIGAFNEDSQIPDQVVVFNPAHIRSVDAKFNLDKLGSSDIRQSRAYSDDQKKQLQWLGERANQLGFKDVDELVDKDFGEFMALAEQWRDENPPNPKARAIEPAPMYASYPVENGGDIVAWAEEQGIRDVIPADKMHVTVAYSRSPVDSRDLPPAPAARVDDEGRSVQILGGDIVLMVQSDDLNARWTAIKEAGASWDFEDEAPAYKPHVTIAYNAEGADVADVEPYDGPIELGEEEIEDLKSGWGAALKQSRPASGYGLPGFGLGSLFIEKIQDRYNRWLQVVDAVRKQGGILNEANDFYKAEERYWGVVGSKIEDFDAEVQTFLEGLVKDKIDARSMQLYAYAKHAKERNARMRTIREANPQSGFDSWSGMTDEDADAILDDAHQSGLAPLLDKHHAELMKWTQGTRDLMLNQGLITQDQYDALQNSYDFYVPLKGNPRGDTKRPGVGQGFNIRGKETMRAKGRYSEASDIIENIIADRVRALTRAGKNEVLRTFLKFVLDNPDPTNWVINDTQINPVMTIDDQGNQVIKEERQVMKGEDTIGIKDGGREVFVRIKDPKLVEQMRNMGIEQVGWFLGHMLRGNRMLSRLYTSLSPVFTVLNFARDLQAGTVNMIGTEGFTAAARMLSYMPKAMYQSAMAESGKPPAEYQLFRATGGKTGFMDFKTIEDLAKDLATRIDKAGMSGVDPRKFGPKSLELIEAINGAIENSTRLAAFMAARDSGRTVAEAASVSKNITVNFNRKGTLTPNLAAWFLFFNPAVQGTARVAQALASPKVLATLGAGMTGLALLALQNASMGDDDDGVAWWDKIPESVKDRNIVIVLPPESRQGEAVPGSKTGRYIKIPMPYGYNFFATVARQAVDLYRNKLDPARGATMGEATKRSVGSLLGAYMPVAELSRSLENTKSLALVATPDVINAPMQNLLNLNSFGRQMYPDQASDNLADSSRYFAGQAGTIFQRAAEGMNKATGGSTFKSGLLDFTPATLENLARSYGGGPVSFALDMLNMAYVRQSIERPTIDVRRSPFIKQLYGEIDNESDRQAGFERMDKIQSEIEPIQAALRAGKKDEAKEMFTEAGPIATLGGALKVTRKQMTTIRKQELAIIASDKSDAEKYARLEELAANKRKSLQALNRAYDAAARKPMPALAAAED